MERKRSVVFFPAAGGFVLLAVLFSFFAAQGCSRRAGGGAAHAGETPGEPGWLREECPWAFIKPGPEPLWFELGPEGPALLDSPDRASLSAWTPWPGAGFVADFLLRGSHLVMAVNRGGFLVWDPSPEHPGGGDSGGMAALYLVDVADYWKPYTVTAFFYRDGAPSALLHRDGIFGPAEEPPGAGSPPGKRVWALTGFAAVPRIVPAFEVPGGGWDVKSLRQGRNGDWYFRAERIGGQPESSWFRAGNFSDPAETVSFGVFRNAIRPYTVREAPEPLGAVLLASAGLAENGENPIARIVLAGEAAHAAGIAGVRFYGAEGDGGDTLELHGFCAIPAGPFREGADIEAMVLRPDGRGIYSAGSGPVGFALPSLPEGFVYTRAGLAGGRNLIAAWEEQQDWSVAAAGFMVITVPDTVPEGNQFQGGWQN